LWLDERGHAAVGLPGLNGFIATFDFKGSFRLVAGYTAVAVLGLLITAIVFMRAMQALFSGPLGESCEQLPDLRLGERWIVVPITLLMFAIGIYPQFVLNIFNTTVVQMARLLG
jgi:NADH-quinone oxidoreductase subunit M